MALKLFRTDQDSNSKTLSQGIHEFGRGVFLDCDDKRVSRCHGKLEVGEDSRILLTALHKNPCFVTVKDSTEKIIMTQGMTKELSEGDKFGLLPTAYWYQLTKIAENDQGCKKEAIQNSEDTIEADVENPDSPLLDFAIEEELDNNVDKQGSPSLLDTTKVDVQSPDSPLLNLVIEEELDNNFDSQASPSLLGSETQNYETTKSASGNLDVDVKLEQHSSSDTTDRIDEDSPSKPTKRLHSPDLHGEDPGSSAKQTRLSTESPHVHEQTPLKKIKEEINDSPDEEEVKPVVKSEVESVKVEPGVKTEPIVKQDPDAPSCSNNSAAPNPTRERCMYGAQCYSEPTKTSTTQIQVIRSRKKSNAQKCKEYRARKKLEDARVPKNSAQRSDECRERDHEQEIKKPKTDAQRSKEYRERKKSDECRERDEQEIKKPKTDAQRSKEYRERQKMKKQIKSQQKNTDRLRRRNPTHKQQFSHPDDKDWGAGDKAPCPWGSSCARRDPRHWRDHGHPPGTVPPDPNAPRASRPPGYKKRNKKKRVSSDEEDELLGGSGNEGEVKLPAKRVRRTVKRTSWSGTESENEYDLEDPFLTDGSDDWQPSE